MRTTAILNLKGGVAKTTTAVNMAAILSREHGKKVLLIDADSQCNTTEFCCATGEKGDMAKALRLSDHTQEIGRVVAGMIEPTNMNDVYILPGSDELMDLDLSSCQQGSANLMVIRKLLLWLQTMDYGYDYVLIDCPGAFNAASSAAMAAADDVLIPVKLDAFSLRGMGNIMRQIKNLKRINPQLKLAGILPTMWYRDDQIKESEANLSDAGLRIYHHIRRSDSVDGMTYRQEPLCISCPHSGAGIDYRKFVKEYVEG